MNKTVKNLLFLVIAIVIVGLILYPKLKPAETGPATASPRASSVVPVEGKVISAQPLDNTIRVTGAVLANESVAMKSEISGKVEKIYFKEGNRVKKGNLMLTINSDEIEAQLERLKFTQQLNEDIEFRLRQLLEKEAISREEYEIGLTTLNTTLSDIKEQEAILAKHQIVAPFDGIIGLRQVSEGSYISPSDLIVSIYNINPIKIEFSVPGKYSSNVKKGDVINFSVEASENLFEGKIYAIEPRIDPQTRTLKIRAICNNDSEVLIPGQFANIAYTLNSVNDALMVPSQAIIPELNSHKLFTYKSGKVSQSTVVIGLRTDSEVQVMEGLNPGDTVITTGILQIRQGMPVSLTTIN